MLTPRRLLFRTVLLACAIAGCDSGNTALVTVGADGPVDQYDLYVRDEGSHTILKHTGWSNFNRDITQAPFKIGLELPAAGTFSVVMVGVKGPVDGNHPAKGSLEYFWATTTSVSGSLEISATLLHVPDGDDMDQDIFPDAVTWLQHLPEASSIPMTLLDCDDKTDYPMKKIFAAMINPFATEICGDGIDEDCNGDADEQCMDRDGDGDPDSTDCQPDDPKIHHPTSKDPYPQSANCCGYSLGKTGTDANMSFANDPLCHPGTCDDGIFQDCSGKDVTCIADQDCDQFRAAAKEDNACTAPPDKDQTSPNLDCDDCNPKINPNAPEVCDGLDNNCNGATDETCVTCDLDGDGFQRMDAPNGCPTAMYVQTGMALDCDDEDAGVFPGSTGSKYPVGKLMYLSNALTTCNGKAGGSVCGALRALCKNVKTDGTTAQDEACDGMGTAGCPPANCDADGDGFIDSAKAAQCDPNGALAPYDCDDTDPTTFPNAPSQCNETKAHNCTQAQGACGNTDADGDGYDSDHDCNDADKTVHPWATELCDGVDNDCDGLKDELNPDETGARMVQMGHVTFCTDSNVGECAKAPIGHCVCSASQVSDLHFEQGNRTSCPGEDANVDAAAGSKARCYGAHQPGQQSCNPQMPLDDDCDGRVDAPDGKNFPQVGMPCWPAAVGQCAPAKGGKITGCDMTKMNCFSARGVNAWLTCDNTEICPVAEKCNGFDDDCDGNVPVNETDVDGDGYVACGSQYPMYSSNQACEMNLKGGIMGCGDCADSVGVTMGIANNQIHPGQPDNCDGVDNDCNPTTVDGAVDCPGPKPAEICCAPQGGCKDPANDVNNCNGCNIVCNLANAVPQCVTSACAIKSCNAPFQDCDNSPVDGCEINLNTTATHCGACGNNCSANNMATITCGGGTCNGMCAANFLDCNGNKLTDGCEVNSQTDATHCGGCANNCSGNNMATITCAIGTCNGNCNAGFLDCNGNKLTDGCEINSQTDATHCGGCANGCSNNNMATVTCGGGTCNGNCNGGFADCDGNKLLNGCEINLQSDANHCGGCANVCSNNNMNTRTCGGGLCNGACTAGFFDCDGSKLGDGCELDGRSDPNNCGGCSVSCSAQNMATRTCTNQLCSGTCNGGFFDCNGNKKTDGCELDGRTDVLNCGGCGIVCSTNNIARACSAQSCSAGTCTNGFFDCNGNKQSDGCELDGRSDVLNCGGCGVVCSSINITRACSAQSCNAGVCNAGFFDCDGNKQVDGCELDGRSDPFNCGGCSKVCSNNNITTPTCSNQVCNGTCNGTWFDCNGNKQTDGCEIDLANDANNCGGCGTSCSNNGMATRTCGGSMCNGTCAANRADCDGNKQSNGCEINTSNDASNCGGCGTKCAGNDAGHACVGSNCGCNVVTDCNGAISDGCASPNCTCGGGASCNPATQTCTGAKCRSIVGQTCTLTTDCASGKCELKQDGTKVCASTTCSGCQVINNAGTACVNATNGTDPRSACGASNSGHTCEAGVCGCAADSDCPIGLAPHCFGAQCGCGAGGTFCTSGSAPLCTTFDNTGVCKQRPGGNCSVMSDCDTGTCSATCMGTLPASAPCSLNADCTNNCVSGTCN